MPHDPLLPRHVSKERAARYDAELLARLAGAPAGHLPYAVWSCQVDEHCRERNILLARPKDFTPERLRGIFPAKGQPIPVEHLLQYQEAFYRDRYHDPTFAFDRSKLHLPQDRVADILDALTRKEVNYPLVVATPRALTEVEARRTLHRVLMDRLIRARRIPVWQRMDPTTNTFLKQMRDVTLGDLTRTDLAPKLADASVGTGRASRDAGVSPFAFDEATCLPYLQALYPTLPHPTAVPGYLDCSFTAWEGDLPASRVIPHTGSGMGQALYARGQALYAKAIRAVTIRNRSQLDAVAYRYPLITPSRYLALFAQYHAATGGYLNTKTWSCTFGIVKPQRSSNCLTVNASSHSNELNLCRDHPGVTDLGSRLRSSR